jgi:hypothetical protein
MRTRLIILCAFVSCVLFLGALFFRPETPTRQNAKESYSVKKREKPPDTRNTAELEIVCTWSSGKPSVAPIPIEIRSDAHVKTVLLPPYEHRVSTLLPSGTYAVSILSTEHEAIPQVQDVELAVGFRKEARFVLTPKKQLLVSIRAEDGTRIETAQLSVPGLLHWTTISLEESSGTLWLPEDEDRTSLSGLEVLARARGFAAARSQARFDESGVSRVDFHLKRGGTIRGRISTRGGTAIRDAIVSIASDSQLEDVFSDGEGRFELPSVPFGSYRVSGKARGFLPQTVKAELTESASTFEVDLILDAGWSLTGHVSGVSGEPIEGASASCANTSTSSDASGHFKLSGITPSIDGKITDFRVSAPGFCTAWFEALAPDAHVQVRLSKSVRLHIDLRNVPENLPRSLFLQFTLSRSLDASFKSDGQVPTGVNPLSVPYVELMPGYYQVTASVAGIPFTSVQSHLVTREPGAQFSLDLGALTNPIFERADILINELNSSIAVIASSAPIEEKEKARVRIRMIREELDRLRLEIRSK